MRQLPTNVRHPVVMPNQIAAMTVRVMASSASGRRLPCSSCMGIPH
jgi:hypothetical protein